ncbi:MAG: outer membrane protein assembly factor BamE [Albidovulum sp.]|nr:outer membrane protein assembly factor BamE [Albidovulum sp.]MDE0531300.1 outer membrane protein assembly factor BamE [Albidovulum sp.]
MSWIARVFSGLCAAVLASLVVACSPTYDFHGYTPSQYELRSVKVGESTQQEVLEAVGRPVSSGFLARDTWYYVSANIRRSAFREPEFTDRQVVAISFDNEGMVSNVERFGLERGRPVVLSRRVTETELGRLTIIEQLMRSFGRIDPAEALARQ